MPMKNYRIHALQFHLLPALFNVTQQELCRLLGVSTNYMSRHINDGEFKLSEVLKICNKFHIRLSAFITTDEQAGMQPMCSEDGGWKNIEFKSSALKKRLKLEGVTYTRMTHVMQCSRKYLDDMFEQDVPLKKLLNFFNAFGLNLGEFVTDPTLPRLTTISQDVKAENVRLRREVQELREELFMLRQMAAKKKGYRPFELEPFENVAEV